MTFNNSTSAELLEKAIDRQPITVNPDSLVIDVLIIMSQKRASYSLILDQQKLIGIFTERDAVKITASQINLAGLKISQIMSAKLITLSITEKDDIFSVLSLLRSAHIRHLPILDLYGGIIGVITPESLRKVLQPTDLLQIRRVAEVMATEVITASPDTSIFEIAKLMVIHRKSCVVICTPSLTINQQIPLGIITERDIVKFKVMGIPLTQTIAETVMSKPLLPIPLNASLWQANQMMQKHSIRRLVVVYQEGFLAGIITQSTLLQSLDPVELYATIDLLQQTVTQKTLELRQTNERMQREVAERQQIQQQLKQLSKTLEKKVDEQTIELIETNYRLKQMNEDLEKSNRQQSLLNQELEIRLQQLQQAQIQLMQSEKMSDLGQLIAGVAHEINNPVSFIKGNLIHAQQYIYDLLTHLEFYQQQFPHPGDKITTHAAAIELDYLTQDLPQIINSLNLGIDRISQISTSLRNFSRSDTDAKSLADIHQGIDSTLVILQSRLKSSPQHPEIKIIKNYGTLPLIEFYPGLLNQVFMNILANAIDALEEANQDRTYTEIAANPNYITITTKLSNSSELNESSQVIIRIKDNGPGIPPEVKNRIFEHLFTTKPVGKGTGLGLSISYQIVVEKHGGTLTCESELGKGTEFIITIPVK